jgi:hypothetical protein
MQKEQQSRNYVTGIVTSANCNENVRRLLPRWVNQTIKFCKRSSDLATVPRLSLTLIFGVLVGLVSQFHSFLGLYLTSKAEHDFTKPYLKLQQQDTPKLVQPKAALQLSNPAG